MSALIRWWAIFCSIATGVVFLQINGMFQKLWSVDHSKLSFVVLAVFFILSIFIGFLTDHIVNKRRMEDVRFLQACWFGSDALMAIGMAGTLIGFMMIYDSNMAHVDSSTPEQIRPIISQLTKGFTTGIVTTLVGIVTSLFAKLQIVNLEVSMEKYDENQ